MKKLSLYVFLGLIWFNPVNAKDCIKIENICLGESALKFFSKKKLKDTEYYYFDDKNFVTSIIKNDSKFKTFEVVEIDYNKSDPQYKILYINGRISVERPDACLVKMEEYNNLISSILNIDGKYSRFSNAADEKNESYVTTYEFKKGDKIISLECYEWSKRMQSRFYNNFTMSVTTKKFKDFQLGVVSTY